MRGGKGKTPGGTERTGQMEHTPKHKTTVEAGGNEEKKNLGGRESKCLKRNVRGLLT